MDDKPVTVLIQQLSKPGPSRVIDYRLSTVSSYVVARVDVDAKIDAVSKLQGEFEKGSEVRFYYDIARACC